jgi:hypothetical protein
MKRLLSVLLFSLSTAVVAQIAPANEPICAPATADDVRIGAVNADLWFYWWCRSPDHVWLTWNGYLATEMKTSMAARAGIRVVSPDPYNDLIVWGPPADRPETAHLKAAVIAAASVDAGKPDPGPEFVPTVTLPQLWNVTPNGASPTRKTNLVEGGKVVPKYGTQVVKVLTPCDCSVVSFPEGSVTKKCPVAGKIVTEVLSCMRLR